MNQFFGQWLTGPFGMYVFIFYEVQIGLFIGLIALAFILYAIWNAVNDPLIGYIMDRKKMGKIEMLVCTLLFWKFYDLTPDKVAANKIKLRELGL